MCIIINSYYLFLLTLMFNLCYLLKCTLNDLLMNNPSPNTKRKRLNFKLYIFLFLFLYIKEGVVLNVIN